MQTPLSVFIFNAAEDEWKFSDSLESSYNLSDSYLYMNSFYKKSILITPIPISEQFHAYVEKLANISVVALSPIKRSYSICKNILNDKKIYSYLLDAAQKNGNILEIRAYVSTPELIALIQSLKNKGVSVLLPENTHKEHLWTVDYFGSKAGFRSQFSHFMPRGTICYSTSQAIKEAEHLLNEVKAIVVKTNKGNAGEGVVIIKKGKKINLQKLFDSKAYWKKNPIVVEEFIDTSLEKESPFPSIEGFITPSGKATLPYYCNMIVTDEGEFYGIVMHHDSVSGKIKNQMEKMTMEIGNTYAKSGYRGRFDVDYLFDGNRLYANESNTRTNGGTDTYFITRKLVGDDFFSSRYVLSNYLELRKKVSMDMVMKMVSPLLYDKKTKTGFILGSENALNHKGLSFILIGKNKRDTDHLAMRLNERIKSILTIKKNPQ